MRNLPRHGTRLGRRLLETLACCAVCLALSMGPRPARVAGHAQQHAPPPASALPNLRLARDGFLGHPDALILDRLIQGEVTRIKKGGGGRSLGFKLYFEGGTKGYFKPAQSFSGANWFSEVAAYHLDRLLGMGRVPPVVSYRMPWATLRAEAGRDRRIPEIEVEEDGSVRGALVYWLPEALEPADTPPGWERWLRTEGFVRWSITPFQRPAAYAADLRARKQRAAKGLRAKRYFDETPTPADPQLPAALADMLVLDFLTLNIDRWGGNNANVLCYGDGDKTLIFLDNGAGFSPGPHRRGLMDDRLAVQQRFRSATVAALRRLDINELARRLAGEAHGPILGDNLLAGVEVRRRALLAHVDALLAKHGPQSVLIP